VVVDQPDRLPSHLEVAMDMYAVDTAFQLVADRRERLLTQVARRRRLRRRPVTDHLPGSPPDAA
jgi:hypothetical protein